MCVCLYMPLPLLAPLLLRVCADPNSHAMDCPRLRKPCLPEGRGAAVLLREWNHIVWDKLAYGPPLPDNSKQLIHVGFFDTRPSPSLWEMGKAAALFNSSGVVVHALLAVKPVAADVPSGIRVTMMKLTKRLACIYDNFAHNSHGPGPVHTHSRGPPRLPSFRRSSFYYAGVPHQDAIALDPATRGVNSAVQGQSRGSERCASVVSL